MGFESLQSRVLCQELQSSSNLVPTQHTKKWKPIHSQRQAYLNLKFGNASDFNSKVYNKKRLNIQGKIKHFEYI